MKNYDNKSAVEDFTNKETTKVNKRVAFLVPNMFNRVSKGFLKNKPVATIETPVVEETPVQEVSTPVVENVQPVQEVPTVQQNVENVSTVQQEQTEKNYSLKKLIQKITTTDNNQRRLLISSVFLQKLLTNVKMRLESVQQVVEEVKTGETALENAINRYHELMDERTNHINEIKNIERELTGLVQEFKLTQEQVNARAKVA